MHDSVKSSLHQQNIQKTHKQFQERAGRVKHKTRAVILLYLLYKEKGQTVTLPPLSRSGQSHSVIELRVTRWPKNTGARWKPFASTETKSTKKTPNTSFNKLYSSTHLFKAILPNSAAPPGGAAWYCRISANSNFAGKAAELQIILKWLIKLQRRQSQQSTGTAMNIKLPHETALLDLFSLLRLNTARSPFKFNANSQRKSKGKKTKQN